MKTSFPLPVRLVALVLSFFLGTGAFAQNSMMFLQVKAAKQGEIKGDVFERGKEGLIKVVAYAHEIVSPRDVASGMATGKRQHKPFVITKELDKASPQLFTALANNEILPEVTLTFYRPGLKGAAAGAAAQYFTIKLTNASISGIQSTVNEKGQPVEAVSFTYQKITWTYTDGGVSAEDSWTAPK